MLTASIAVGAKGSKSGGEVGQTANIDGLELDAEQPRRLGEQLHSRRCASWIAKDGEAPARGHDLL